MKKVLIANSQPEEAAKIKKFIRQLYDIRTISDPAQLKGKTSVFDVILIDHNFTLHSGIDFLMEMMRKKAVPVLMLTPADDTQCAVEALRAGAFNYIVKSGGYFRFLDIAIKDAIHKFEETAQLKQTISDLQSKFGEIEKKTGIKLTLPEKRTRNQPVKTGTSKPAAPEIKAKPEPKKEVNLMEEIISRFKKGEVNLPTIPQISIQFNALIKKGANLKEVADFLKKDLAISSKLVNVANSALYRGIEQVSKLEDAIGRLGLGTTRQYVEIIANRSLYTSGNPRFSQTIEQLWKHSLACAFASEYISKILKANSQADIFALGLTHDIGKLILIQVIGELEVRGGYSKPIDMEKIFSTLNAYHGKFGAVLLKRWHFPDEFITIAMYHNHMKKVKDPSHEYLCVHFANLLANVLGYSIQPAETMDLENSESGYLLRLRSEEIEQIKAETKKYIENINKAI